MLIVSLRAIAAGLLLSATMCACSARADSPAQPTNADLPPGLPAALPADSRVRQPSLAGLVRDLWGRETFQRGGSATDNGNAVELSSGAADSGELSYAIHRFQLGGEQAQRLEARLSLNERSDGSESEYWLGLANFGRQRWQWYGPFDDEAMLLHPPVAGDDLSDYVLSPDGSFYCAVAVFDGSALSLHSLLATARPVYAEPLPADETALSVGPGMDYDSIEEAYAAAAEGDTILIYPQAANAPYEQPALQVYKAGIRFRGMPQPGEQAVPLSGAGFNYTGAGSTPRAIFQFNPGADGCLVEQLELYGAHNDSQNGAGVRINQANDITIRDCIIHGCDMGLMSNGSYSEGTAANQRVEYCLIFANGNDESPGFNHNLYMGGTSFTLHGSEVYGALTGHNVKSRAHFNRIEYCYIHDSANRELDLVDEAGNTDQPGSHTLVLGCVIEKAEQMEGNRHTIHWGQDGGADHNGTLYLVHNTIISPYLSPFVQITAAGAGLHAVNNIFWDRGSSQSGMALFSVSNGAQAAAVLGSNNWFSAGIGLAPGHGLELATSYFGADGVDPPFADSAAGDYRLLGELNGLTDAGLPWAELTLPATAFAAQPDNEQYLWEYLEPCTISRRPHFLGLFADAEPDLGAYEAEPE